MHPGRISGFHLYHSFIYGYENVLKQRENLNEINVFPVPDGDTGNNIVHTLRYIVTGMKRSRSFGKVLESIADLSLEGARGNSGIILSRFLNSLAELLGEEPAPDPERLALALSQSSERAYDAMDQPEEGTILTVIRKWARFLQKSSGDEILLAQWMEKGLAQARIALEQTPDEMALLKEKGVVDAGGKGFVDFLEGAQLLVQKGPVTHWNEGEELPSFSGINHRADHSGIAEIPEYRYCSEFLFEECALSEEELKKLLHPLGDSLIVSKGRSRIRVHIHSNRPDTVLQILQNQARIVQQKVDDMLRQNQMQEERLNKVALVTDSIADIPLDLQDSLKIHQIPLSLTWEDEEYLDRITITPEEFYRLQQTRDAFPGSSAPEASRIEASFSALLDHYEHLLVLPVAKALSATWKQMSLAADKWNARYGKRIHVLDSSMNSAAQGLLVTKLAEKAAEGCGLEELIEEAEKLKKLIRIFVSVDTLKFMVKGGRITPLKGFIARLLRMNPVVSLDENGKGVVVDKAFSKEGVIHKIGRQVQNLAGEKGVEDYVIVHASAPERADTLGRMMERLTSQKELYRAEISPVVGMHSGKGAVAVGVLFRE